MKSNTLPSVRDLVLIGGGHTHALVLRRWVTAPLAGARITVINPTATAAYSGMLPGHVAGHYTRADLDIDLVALAQAAGARFIPASATGIDRAARTITTDRTPPIGFDVASIDIGVTSRMPDIPGFTANAIPVKPLDAFADAWSRFLAKPDPGPVVVIGGGVAGAEIALAMHHALARRGAKPGVAIVDADRVLPELDAPARRRLLAALAAASIELHESVRPASIGPDHVQLDDGSRIPADFVVGAAGARPHAWLAETGLTDGSGFVAVDRFLRSRDRAIFAAGDCAAMTESPRPKAGVFAVRQAPVLYRNLRDHLSGRGVSHAYRPQRNYLKLISLGARDAVGERFGLTISGPAVWRWKDRIDRRFMNRLKDLPGDLPAPLPWPRATDGTGIDTQPFCGGCGAKIGLPTLRRGLGEAFRDGDDAAPILHNDDRLVMSTDHLRAMVPDPITMTRIAAVHALGDIWASGADVDSATLSVILPRSAPLLAERSLTEIRHTAEEVLTAAGGRIVGGHSTMGAELTVGFTVIGRPRGRPVTLAGARPGDTILLTKPLGSGLVMAAFMRGRVSGDVVIRTLACMTQPQAEASRLLSAATAMTDVTGFGLVGHLSNICAASRCGAMIDVDATPVMHGALAVAERGIRSSLHAQNRAIVPDAPEDTARMAPLFDPQTAGGLLAAVPPDMANGILKALTDAGYAAARIGAITEAEGHIAFA